MSEREMDPVSSLVGFLHETTPRQAVKLARELCGQLEGEPDSFHGGVWPGNVTLDLEGAARLGRPLRVRARQRSATQAEYTAPEFFWSGDGSAAADVYTVGLMLYAGCAGGRLPFQPEGREPSDKDRADAMRRRMKGEPVTAPAGVSQGLKRVIEKALAYDPEDRYITAKEMLAALNGVEEARQDPARAAAVSAAAVAAAEEVLFAEESAPEDLSPEEAAFDESAPEEAIFEEPAPDDIDPGEFASEAAIPAETPFEEDTPEDLLPGEDTLPEPLPEEPVPEEPISQVPAESASPEPPSPPEPLPEDGDGGWRKEAAAATAAAVPLAEGVTDAAPPHTAPAAKSAPRPEYRVQKHFEKTAPARERKKRRSPAPFLWGAAALAILAGVGFFLLGRGGGRPEASAPFPTQTAQTDDRPETSPVVITPHPDVTGGALKGSPAPEDTPAPEEAEPSPQAPAEPSPAAPSPAPLSAYPGGSGGASGGTGGGYTGSAGGSYTGGTGGTGNAGSTGSYTVEPADDTVSITGIGVNVRSGPGTNYPIIGTVSAGDTLHRTGISGDWSQVRFEGVTGFVYSQYASAVSPTASPAPTEAPAPSPGPVYTVTAEDLTYAQAKEAAAAHGGLAVAKTDEELAALTGTLDGDVAYLWLGVEYDAAAGWQWADGTPIAADDPLWAESPGPDHDGALLARTEDGWKLTPLRLADFDPADGTHAGKLAYATAG